MIEYNYYYKDFLPKEDVKIWRYMDIDKFLLLLESSSIYFSNVKNFYDKHEGALPIKNMDFEFRKNNPQMMPNQYLSSLDERNELVKKNMFISCWHINKAESKDMWNLYLTEESNGISIQTTYNKLHKVFDENQDIINIGQVKYINPYNESVDENNIHHAYLHKIKTFEHEKELRAIIFAGWKQETNLNGISVKVDLNELIENIYIGSNVSEKNKKKLEEKIKSLGFMFNLVNSTLSEIENDNKTRSKKEIQNKLKNGYDKSFKVLPPINNVTSKVIGNLEANIKLFALTLKLAYNTDLILKIVKEENKLKQMSIRMDNIGTFLLIFPQIYFFKCFYKKPLECDEFNFEIIGYQLLENIYHLMEYENSSISIYRIFNELNKLKSKNKIEKYIKKNLKELEPYYNEYNKISDFDKQEVCKKIREQLENPQYIEIKFK